MKALIILEDGAVFEGRSFGASGQRCGEIVFNTSITGYQEVLTDPSYKGQIVTMTYPLIGNYGINEEDVESRGIFVEGFIVKECCRYPSNWRSKNDLSTYLKENNVLGIEGIDTRALTKHIRLKGAMNAIISTDDSDIEKLKNKLKKFPGLLGRDLVKEVTIKEPFVFSGKGSCKVVVLDCGVKYNILKMLAKRGCGVEVLPADSGADKILSCEPDGVLLSNGPGDPQAVGYVINTVKSLIGKLPLFGICLGHQILGIALGGKTYKLKFGHHGGNHPVKDLKTERVVISVQNHCYCIDIDTLNKDEVEITHINLNDNTIEGMRHKKYPLFSVQFHPEACPGPHDTEYLFDEFVALL